MDKKVEKNNKILLMALLILALISTAGAVMWFNIYAPLVLTNN